MFCYYFVGHIRLALSVYNETLPELRRMVIDFER